MRLLLDTHVFLWYISGDTRLSESWQQAVRESEAVFLSTVSVWECVIKFGLAKLALPEAPDAYLPRQRERHGIASLGIDEGVFSFLAKLPHRHRDPFDRMLVAQALQYDLTLATVDPAVTAYGAKFLPS